MVAVEAMWILLTVTTAFLDLNSRLCFDFGSVGKRMGHGQTCQYDPEGNVFQKHESSLVKKVLQSNNQLNLFQN